MNKFVILLDGDLHPNERLRQQCAQRRVIAADGGIRHAAALKLEPELWLGDFDSVSAEDADRYRSVPQIAFPADKDQTDGEIAVAAARERGATDLLLAGAFGGPRADHALLHHLQAVQLAKEGLEVFLSDGRQEGYPLLPGRHAFDIPVGTRFSIVGFSRLAGLTISGAMWPLDKAAVPFASSLTLSNFSTGTVKIELNEGKAILVTSPPS